MKTLTVSFAIKWECGIASYVAPPAKKSVLIHTGEPRLDNDSGADCDGEEDPTSGSLSYHNDSDEKTWGSMRVIHHSHHHHHHHSN